MSPGSELRVYLICLKCLGLLCVTHDASASHLIYTSKTDEMVSLVALIVAQIVAWLALSKVLLTPDNFQITVLGSVVNMCLLIIYGISCLAIALSYIYFFVKRRSVLALLSLLLYSHRNQLKKCYGKSFLYRFYIYLSLSALCAVVYSRAFIHANQSILTCALLSLVFTYSSVLIGLISALYSCLAQILAALLQFYNRDLLALTTAATSRKLWRLALWQRNKILIACHEQLNFDFGLVMALITAFQLLSAASGTLCMFTIAFKMDANKPGLYEFIIALIGLLLCNVTVMVMILQKDMAKQEHSVYFGMFVGRELRLYLRLLYLFGMICGQFDEEQCLLEATAGSERYALVYTLVILCATCASYTYAALKTEDLYMTKYNLTGNCYETIIFRMFCLVLWLQYICLYLKRHRHIALIQAFMQLNQLSLAKESSNSYLRKYLIIYIVLFIFSLINYINGFILAGLKSIYLLLLYVCVYSYSFLVICLVLVFFVCLQYIVAMSLACCNQELQESNSSFACRRIFFERHRLLKFVACELNECFGLLMLPIVPLVLLLTPTSPLFFISTVMEGKFQGFLQFSLGFLTSMLWTVPWLIMMTIMLGSNVITVEANKTAKILAKIPRTGTGLDRMVEKFLLKNLRQQPILTAYGFFALDKSTLFNLFTAIFTYMVILVQFKEMENSTKSLQKTHTT